MTPRARKIVREILQAYGGVWYVAKDDTGRKVAERGAADMLEPKLRELEEEAKRSVAFNPS